MAAAWTSAGLDRLERHAARRRPGRDGARRRPGGASGRAPARSSATSSASRRSPATASGSTRRSRSRRAHRPRPGRDRPRDGRRARAPRPGTGRGRTRPIPTGRRPGWSVAGATRSTSHIVPYVRPAGDRRPGRHALAGARATAQGRGLRIDLDERRQVSVSHFRAEDLATATHDVELVARPETIVHLDAAHRGVGHRELRAGHAARLPRGSGHVPLVVDADAVRGRLSVAIHFDPADRTVPPPQRAHQLPDRASLENGALGHLYFGPAARARPLVRATSAGEPFRGFGNRLGECRAPSSTRPTGCGDYRVPAITVEQPDGSTVLELAYASHRILPGKPPIAGLPATYVEADDEAETARDRPRSTSRAAPRCAARTRSSATCRRSPGASSVRNDGDGAPRLRRAMSAVARPARRATGTSST